MALAAPPTWMPFCSTVSGPYYLWRATSYLLPETFSLYSQEGVLFLLLLTRFMALELVLFPLCYDSWLLTCPYQVISL